MVYKHAVVAAFIIYAQEGEDTTKRGGWRLCTINSHGNYIVDPGISWENHGIVFFNFCGNPAYCYFPQMDRLSRAFAAGIHLI